MLTKQEIEALGKYNFKLVIEKKSDPSMGTVITMDG